MTRIHKRLEESGKWLKLSLIEQLANIGTDVQRAINWKRRNNPKASEAALYRALDLIDLTVRDPKNKKRLKEVLRTREALIDFFVYDNEYNTSDEIWEKYFYQFNYAAAMKRGR